MEENASVFNCTFVCENNIEIEGDDVICSSASYSTSTIANNYTWSITDGSELVTLSGNNTSSITLTQVGSYSGEVVLQLKIGGNDGPCEAVATVTKTIWVGVPKAYTVGFEPVICKNEIPNESELIYSLPESPGAETYQLTSNSPYLTVYGGDYVTPGVGVVMTSTKAGVYTMTLTTTNTCGSAQSTVFVTVESCGTIGGLFSVYPNPTSDELNISTFVNAEFDSGKSAITTSSKTDSSTDESETYSYQIYDKFSNLKYSGEFKDATSLDVSFLSQGLYIIKISSSTLTETYKFVVQ